ncbi:hypothetical protein OKW33_006068 [Paraburkholderia atlantica]|uniref:Uncharacterized protein n=2 Tax=Paraburkholderia TaxID=1822464 RepID=A0A7W8LF98_9BURK|nr:MULTISPECIES: hypothetical protein [Paraburkholderia]MBB5405937.1 hypothetical protein [Paraburkholderia youngii]MBB5421233.1 hypothetical protein [Paraburkholderia atlantica]MBB5429236.1 hypothetical protein [Paraburkholderia atlantica]
MCSSARETTNDRSIRENIEYRCLLAAAEAGCWLTESDADETNRRPVLLEISGLIAG